MTKEELDSLVLAHLSKTISPEEVKSLRFGVCGPATWATVAQACQPYVSEVIGAKGTPFDGLVAAFIEIWSWQVPIYMDPFKEEEGDIYFFMAGTVKGVPYAAL